MNVWWAAALCAFVAGLLWLWWRSAKPRVQEEDAHGRLPKNWKILGLGGAFIVLAVLIENSAIHALLVAFSPPNLKSDVFTLKTLSSLLKELGFALMIAFVISNGIERQAREKHEKADADARARAEREVQDARENIARDVFHGVFGLQHDRGYVNTVIENILQRKVVRERFDVEIAVSALSEDEIRRLGVSENRFVKVHTISEYSFLNISTVDVDFKVEFIIPVREGSELRDFARINTVSINGAAKELSDIQSALVDVSDEPLKKYCFPSPLSPDEKVQVLISSTIIKEMSDNEVWRNMHPTIGGAGFKLRMELPGMKVGVRNLTASPITKRYSGLPGGESAWTIDGPILPNESVVVWWQTLADSGEVIEAPEAKK